MGGSLTGLEPVLGGLTPSLAQQRAARERFCAGQAGLHAYLRQVRQAYDVLGLTDSQRMMLTPVARRVYGLVRNSPGDALLPGLVECALDRVLSGAILEQVLSVVEQGFGVLGMEFGPAEAAELRSAVEARLVSVKNGGSMNDKVQRTKDEVRSGNDEVTKTVRVSELAAKVEEFLAGKLSNRAQAEELARDIAGVVASVEAKPAKGRRKAAPGRGELPESSLVNEPTALDRYRKRNAVAELRLALAGHQPIVKAVVVERLSRHTGFAGLAEKFGLTVDEVTDILSQMRAWVKRFTGYYDKDWYWLDSPAKYHIPALPKTEAERRAGS